MGSIILALINREYYHTKSLIFAKKNSFSFMFFFLSIILFQIIFLFILKDKSSLSYLLDRLHCLRWLSTHG